MADIQTGEPTEFVAGNTVQWLTPENTDYPISDSWVLSYAFVKADHHFSVACTDNGDNNHLATISAADSAKIKAGEYKWQSYITKSTERYPVNSGTLTVLKNFAIQTDGFDGRSHWKTTLDNVEAVIQGRATKDQSSYTVNGRQLSRTPVADLLLLYDRAKAAVVAEEKAEAIAKGLGHSGTIKVRF